MFVLSEECYYLDTAGVFVETFETWLPVLPRPTLSLIPKAPRTLSIVVRAQLRSASRHSRQRSLPSQWVVLVCSGASMNSDARAESDVHVTETVRVPYVHAEGDEKHRENNERPKWGAGFY